MEPNTESDDDLNEYVDTWENEQQGGVLPNWKGHYRFRRVQFP